jgi:hypothetical protein
MKPPIKIAAFSGAAGDYNGALHDAVHGDPVDVLIGDYLAEISTGIVLESFVEAPDPSASRGFYYDLFLRQVTPELPGIAEKGLKIVVNAGNLNPEGLAKKLREAIASAKVDLEVAAVAGDDLLDRVQELAGAGQLRHLDTGMPLGNLSGRILAANAYLGAWGIAAALAAGADIVVTGRVTDASLTVGPAAWWHGWSPGDFDAIAGAIAAGHLIECGPMACGGNFSGFRELGDVIRLGFPIAEIAADGSTVITKQSGSGGMVTVDTVKSQLLYEVQGPRYLNPDAVLHIDSLNLTQLGTDQVRISSVKGSKPPSTTKVSCFYQDGWRMIMFIYITGLDWREKFEWTRRQMQSIVDTLDLDEFLFDPLGQPLDAPTNQAEATMVVRMAAAAQEKVELEKLSAGFGSFGLGGIPGFTCEFSRIFAPRVEFWPGLADQSETAHHVVLEDGSKLAIPLPEMAADAATSGKPAIPLNDDLSSFGPTTRAMLGRLIYARSGDKGGNASLGVWSRSPDALPWLIAYLTPERVHALLGLAENTVVEAFPLPNLDGQLYVLRGHFGRSGTGNIGLDQIGKGLGEFLRSCTADIPVRLLEDARQAAEQAVA